MPGGPAGKVLLPGGKSNAVGFTRLKELAHCNRYTSAVRIT